MIFRHNGIDVRVGAVWRWKGVEELLVWQSVGMEELCLDHSYLAVTNLT